MSSKETVPVHRTIEDIVDKLEKRFEENDASVFNTGITALDNIIGFLNPGDLITIGGRPSMGKTCLSLDILLCAIMKYKDSSLFFSLEQPRNQICARMLSSISKIDIRRIQQACLDDEEWVRLSLGVAILSETNLHIGEGPLSISSLVQKVQKHKQDWPFTKLICIDSINLIQCEGQNNRNEELEEICMLLKNMALELNVTVVITSPLNRSLESRTDRRPFLSDLRSSGAIEDMSDIVLLLYREEIYNKDTSNMGIAELYISKHRNGPSGTIQLLFLPHYCRFMNWIENPEKT